jgi:transposase
MRQLRLFPDNPPGPRWISPPWTTASDRWLEIELDLPADHRARRFAQIVAELDLTALVGSYAGLGSPAYPPELLVRLALFEIHRGCLSPAQWYEDCRYDDAAKWLVFGLRPSRTCLYQFRDRVGPYLDQWNRSVLQTAQAEGRTPMKRAAMDGSFAASYASRHTPIKAKALAQRCQQLDAALAADFSPLAESPPEPAPAADPTPMVVHETQPCGNRFVEPVSAADPTPMVVHETQPCGNRFVEPVSAADPTPMVVHETQPCGNRFVEPVSAADPTPMVVDLAPQAGNAPEPAPTAQPTPAPTAEATSLSVTGPATVPALPATPAEKPSWMAKTPGGRFRQRQRYRRAQELIKKRQKQQKETMSRQAKAKRRSPERMKISLTDPEAPLGFDKTKVFRPLFNIQFACDLDSPFILGYDVFAAVTDANLLGPTLERTQELSGPMLEVVLNDNKYASILNLKLCDDLDITMYAPLPNSPSQPAGPVPSLGPPSVGPGGCGADPGRPAKQARLIPKSEFTWLPEAQTYRCPAGHLLVLQRRGTQQRTDGELVESQYRCPAEHCQACPLASRCTRSPQHGRIVKRSEHDDLYDALRQRMSQPEGRAVYRLRKQTVERQFADLKQHRSLRQFASFGLKRARIQVGLLVLAHNGLELLKARSQGADKATPSLQAG